MARSSRVDAVEKFRFTVSVLNVAFDPVSIIQSITTFVRAGFAEASLPKRTTAHLEYRENLDAAHVLYSAGLTRFEPIVFKRGVTRSSDFYRWVTDVHDLNAVTATSIMRNKVNPFDNAPSDNVNYRRDVIITLYGRGGAVPPILKGNAGTVASIFGTNKLESVAGAAGLSQFGLGDVIKVWLIKDAWVSSYSPGDGLSAKEDGTKLIEELELRYDSYEEISLETLIDKALNLVTGNII